MKSLFGFLVFFLFSATSACANNLSVSNVTMAGRSATAKTALVQFDVSWDHSWRNSVNHDAVWIFIKYSTDGGATFSHATLKTAGLNPSGFSTGSGTGVDIVVPEDLKGAFLRRASNGSGSVNTTSLQLVWDWNADKKSQDGVTPLSVGDSVIVKVFGVEMVYVTETSFYLGDGAGSGITGQFENQTSGVAGEILSEAQVTLGGNIPGSIGNNNASGMSTADDFADATSQTLPEIFPKGYQGFYLMKYEISQGQYVDFLNGLTRAQQKQRVAADISGDTVTNVYVLSDSGSSVSRNTVTCPGSGNGTTVPVVFTAGSPDRACNWLSWMDLCAYADWAGLRPMTELEFEKACRGSNAPVEGEYACGTTITAAASLSGSEDGTETVTTSGANCVFGNTTFTGGDGGAGPLRVGIFAQDSTTRIQSGSGFYGNMELSGNVREATVSVGHSKGRAFTGSHGDGALSTQAGYEGNATNTDWPGIDATASRGITGASGSGSRGGDWYNASSLCRVSDRTDASSADSTRSAVSGGRVARTAP